MSALIYQGHAIGTASDGYSMSIFLPGISAGSTEYPIPETVAVYGYLVMVFGSIASDLTKDTIRKLYYVMLSNNNGSHYWTAYALAGYANNAPGVTIKDETSSTSMRLSISAGYRGSVRVWALCTPRS